MAAESNFPNRRKSYQNQDLPIQMDVDKNEAELVLKQMRQRKLEEESDPERLRELERKLIEEKEKEEAEIKALKEKMEIRKKERDEEERKLAKQREAAELKHKKDEEERKRERQEAERQKKLKEINNSSQSMSPTKPNFVIKKTASPMSNVVKAKDDLQKSKEQLDEEKRAILEQRIQPLRTEGMNAEKLIEKAREIHKKIYDLESEKYDLEQRFKRQQYDMMELSERARQMNKGKKKGQDVNQTPDPLMDKFPSAPPKVQLCSRYERHTDNRTFKDRFGFFAAGNPRKAAAAPGEEDPDAEAEAEESAPPPVEE